MEYTYGRILIFVYGVWQWHGVSVAIERHCGVDFNCYNSEHKQGYPLNEDAYKIRYG